MFFLRSSSAKRITILSLISLVLAHSMINNIFPNTFINFFGLLITSYFIFYNTLRKQDFFSFLMVIYFCSTFPYLLAKGGGFNLVIFICVSLYLMAHYKIPGEHNIVDKFTNFMLGLWIVSSILGWLLNFVGSGSDYLYSITTFLGVVFIFNIARKTIWTKERIEIFIKLNLVLIIYSTIASLNKYIGLIKIRTPLFPIYGEITDYFEGGGLIGSSPLYGEHSLIILILFSAFLITGSSYINISKTILIVGAFIAYINVFMSISRSVFLLSILGLILIYIFQFKLKKIEISAVLYPLIVLLITGGSVFYIVKLTGIDYVFHRVEEIQERNMQEGGITIDRILDGTAFNRGTAFAIASERYYSRDNWTVGYGWGLDKNNRYAFYVDPNVLRGSAHSQIFAILFLFGWIGFIGYFGLIFHLIFKSYRKLSSNDIPIFMKTMILFFLTAFIVFILNEIKADSISKPSYFTITMIWLGTALSIVNSNKYYRDFKIINVLGS